MEISVRDARRLFLHQQGLLRRNQFGRGINAAARALTDLSYVQIDTISVVERAHHHVLRTRVGNYDPKIIDRLLAQRRVFEYWSHAAAILPIANYRFYLSMMRGFAANHPRDDKLVRQIRQRIKEEGPLASRDFEKPPGHTLGGWWDWKPAKRMLETMYLSGELMIARREGFQKVFDLTENVLPADIDTTVPSTPELCRFIAKNMINALGVGSRQDLGYALSAYRRFTKTPIYKDFEQALGDLVAEGELVEVGVGGQTWYSTEDLLGNLPLRMGRKRAQLLSPFDNVVINRKRANLLFDFDYQIECYVPAEKRVYGYFCLPLLWGDELIGRMDAKAVRKSSVLEIYNLCLEPRVSLKDDSLLVGIAEGTSAFSMNNQCTSIVMGKTTPASLRVPLQRLLAA